MVAARIRLAELPAAHAAHERLAAIAEAVGTLPLRAAERYAAGRIALAERDPRGARAGLEDALDLYLRGVMPFDAAQVRLELAAALGDDGQPAAALEQALAARATFAELGAAAAVKAADKLVMRLGGRGAAARSLGMTAREVEVLSLVARGLSNRAIAERLVVSEHTVHRHLANIYARLGVSSRAAAVAVASDRDLLD
jgi:DNA-binding CsgD family transcriptional regulator